MKNKVKVVFFINTFLLGGIEKVLIEYLKNINKNKFDISLVIGLNMGPAQVLLEQLPKDISLNYLVNSKFINRYKIKKIITRKKLFLIEKIIEALFLTPLCKIIYNIKIIKEFKDKDVIVDFGFSYKLPKLSIPIVSFMHFSLSSYLNWNLDFNSKSYKYLLKQFQQRHSIITLNEEMKNEVLKHYPDCINKFISIYNPFDLKQVRELSNEPLDISKYIGSNGFILSVCRLEEVQKDISCLIKAFDILVKKYNYSGSLVIVGDGKSLELLKALVCSLGVLDRVYFEGFKVNTLNYMKHADLFVLSSKYEGLPGVLIEAITVGVPVISSDCPTGPREILQNGSAGLLFEIGNYEQLSILMNELLTNIELRDRLIQNGLRRSFCFSVESNVTKLENVLIRVINE